MRPAAGRGGVRLLRQAEEHLEGVRLFRLLPERFPAVETCQAGDIVERGPRGRLVDLDVCRQCLPHRSPHVREVEGTDTPPAVRCGHTGRHRQQDYRPRDGTAGAQGRYG